MATLNLSTIVKSPETVIRCKIWEEYVVVCVLLNELGLTWKDGTKYNDFNKKNVWDPTKGDVCIYPLRGIYCDISFYEKKGYKVVNLDELSLLK